LDLLFSAGSIIVNPSYQPLSGKSIKEIKMESKQSSMSEDQGDDEEEIYFDQQTSEVLVISAQV
jgi:hypothetical protein